MTAITRQLAEFAARVSYDKLPFQVRERAKWLITDLVGIAVRARHEAESTPSLLAAVEDLGLAQGKGSAIGDPATYSPAGAALINGTLAHSLDFDDTHAPGSIHSSAPIVPAAFAAAEMAGAGGRRRHRGHCGRLRDPDPPEPGAGTQGSLRSRLSPDRDLWGVRRGGGGG